MNFYTIELLNIISTLCLILYPGRCMHSSKQFGGGFTSVEYIFVGYSPERHPFGRIKNDNSMSFS